MLLVGALPLFYAKMVRIVIIRKGRVLFYSIFDFNGFIRFYALKIVLNAE